MIAWFARNHVAANILLLSIIAGGLYSAFFRTPLSTFPDFEPGVVEVYTSIPAASPEDVEEGITNRIEQAIYDLEGIDEVVSVSEEGFSSVTAKINLNFDAGELRDEIQSRVFAITTLPETALQPVIFEHKSRSLVLDVVLYGDADIRELRDYAEVIEDELLDLELVNQVQVEDWQKYEITIEIPQNTLDAHQLSLRDIATLIDANSRDLSAGNLKTAHQSILVRTGKRAYHHEEFASLIVKNYSDGSVLRLGEIANINDNFVEDEQAILRFNGEPAAIVKVFRNDQDNQIKISNQVHRYVQGKQAQLPDEIRIGIWRDRSKVLKQRLSTMTGSAVQGMILVLLALSLFLQPLIAIWVFIGIPVSILGSFMVLPTFDITLNVVSLLGFIMLLGIVVDDAIVTGESVYYHRGLGKTPMQAAIDGTRAVNIPVTFGVLTTVAGFATLIILSQGTGLVVIFAVIPVVIIPALLFSLVESKLVLPAHLAQVPTGAHSGMPALTRLRHRITRGLDKVAKRYYVPLLARLIRHRWASLLGFFGAFVISIVLLAFNWLNFTFFPKVEGEVISMQTSMPSGINTEITREYGQRSFEAAKRLSNRYVDENGSIVLNILESISNDTASTFIEIKPPEEREIEVSMHEMTQKWREEVGSLPGAKSINVRAEIIRLSDPVNIQLRGSDGDKLLQVIQKIKTKLATYPGVFDIADNFSDGKEEIRIELNELGHSLGLNRQTVMSQLRAYLYGIEAQRIQRGPNDIRVKVRIPKSERDSISDLEHIRIRLADGGVTQLANIADLQYGKSASSVRHVDLKRAVNLTADIDKSNTDLSQLYGDLGPWMDNLLKDYPLIIYSFEGEFSDQQTTFDLLIFGLSLALFAIYALLAIPLKSYLSPFIILSIIPFSFVGVVFGHWLLNYDMSVISLLGMIGLIGVIVNDSLLISNEIINRRRGGAKVMYAILTAGVRRFRPVFLTSITTFLGLLPILLDESTQARFLIPMAISLSIGILFATVITLVQVPLLFVVMEDLRRWWFDKSSTKLTDTDGGAELGRTSHSKPNPS